MPPERDAQFYGSDPARASAAAPVVRAAHPPLDFAAMSAVAARATLPRGEERSRERASVSILVAAAVLALLVGAIVKAPEFVLPIGPDQGTYSYVAERILDGGLPYRDAWDNKPLLTYYVHAAVLALVPPSARWDESCIPGLAQQCGYVALQVVDLLWASATALVLFAVGRQVTGRATVGVLAAVLFAVYANVSQLSREGSTPEKELLLPMVMAYWAVQRAEDDRRRGLWLILAGAFAGVAFLFKQTAVSIPIALALWGAWTGWQRRDGGKRSSTTWQPIFRFSLGFLLPVAAVGAYFAARGGLADFWNAAFAYNLVQAGSSAANIPLGFAAGAWQVFSGSSGLLWLLALAGSAFLISAPARSDAAVLVLAWAAADVASLFLGGAKFAQVYFVQVVPSFALLGAIALDAAWRATRGRWIWRGYGLLVVGGVLLLSSGFQARVTLRAWNDRIPPRSSVPADQQNRGTFQRLANLGPIFVWGDASQVYVLVHGRSPSRFFHIYPLSPFYSRGPGVAERRAELLGSFEHQPPAAILVDPATDRDDPEGTLGLNLLSFPELEQLIARAYRPVAAGDLAGGWKAYERR